MNKTNGVTLAMLCMLCQPVLALAPYCTNAAIPQSTPTADFSFHANATVTHNPTGLIWKRCLEGTYLFDNGTAGDYSDDQCLVNIGSASATSVNWPDALKQADDSIFAGEIDWRVPNIKELMSVIEYCRQDQVGAWNFTAFPGGYLSEVWSSSPVVNWPPDRGQNARVVDFRTGESVWVDRQASVHVRLVRGGQ